MIDPELKQRLETIEDLSRKTFALVELFAQVAFIAFLLGAATFAFFAILQSVK